MLSCGLPSIISEKEGKPLGHKKCEKCSKKMPLSVSHTLCVYCLGPLHLQESCAVCHVFNSRALLEQKKNLILKGLIKTSYSEAIMSYPSSPKSEKLEKLGKWSSPAPKSSLEARPKQPKLCTVTVPLEQTTTTEPEAS